MNPMQISYRNSKFEWVQKSHVPLLSVLPSDFDEVNPLEENMSGSKPYASVYMQVFEKVREQDWLECF